MPWKIQCWTKQWANQHLEHLIKQGCIISFFLYQQCTIPIHPCSITIFALLLCLCLCRVPHFQSIPLLERAHVLCAHCRSDVIFVIFAGCNITFSGFTSSAGICTELTSRFSICIEPVFHWFSGNLYVTVYNGLVINLIAITIQRQQLNKYMLPSFVWVSWMFRRNFKPNQWQISYRWGFIFHVQRITKMQRTTLQKNRNLQRRVMEWNDPYVKINVGVLLLITVALIPEDNNGYIVNIKISLLFLARSINPESQQHV